MLKLLDYEILVCMLEIAYGIICFISTKDSSELVELAVDISELLYILATLN